MKYIQVFWLVEQHLVIDLLRLLIIDDKYKTMIFHKINCDTLPHLLKISSSDPTLVLMQARLASNLCCTKEGRAIVALTFQDVRLSVCNLFVGSQNIRSGQRGIKRQKSC